jgi:peptide/nickel transport system substrate-binding protein
MSRKSFILLLMIMFVLSSLIGCRGDAAGPVVAEEPTATAVANVEKATTEEKAPEKKADPTAPPAPTATPAVGDVSSGYYNLADFESQTGKKLTKFNEAPSLADKVKKGELPPVEQRLPDNPLVMRTLDQVGVYGGTLRFNSITIDQDWHMRHINSANLIEMPPSASWDAVSTVFGVPRQPGIFEKFGMSPDGKVFSATIRKGLKWSDGVPVTTEDVKFKINDILLNKTLSPVAPTWMNWGGSKTEFVVIDEYSFEFRFASPYGAFIESEVTLWPATFYRLILPKHFLSNYHKDYVSEADLLKAMEENEYKSLDEWPEFFGRKAALFGADNTFLDKGKMFPTLNPWMLVEDLGNGNYRLERNPYFYMVDQEGNQLPYIETLKRSYLSDSEMENMSIISGKTDLSCMSISIDSFPLYKEHEKDGNYIAMPLPAWQDQIFIFGFNEFAGVPPLRLQSIKQNPIEKAADVSSYDPGLSTVYSDVRFRQAMSIAIDRKTMNETLFLGLGRPAQVAPRPGTPFYKEGMEESYAQYDPEGAKKLLDEMGMVDLNGDGWRERPDGKAFAMKYDYFVITGASTPGSELLKRYWEAVGIKVDLKLVDPGYWWGVLQPNNQNEATTWWLAGSGANLLQNWFLGPSMLNPLWNNYTTYKGQVSDEDWELILQYVPEWQREMQDLRVKLKSEPDEQKRIEYGTRMWEIQAEWLPILGVATDTRAPLIISADIANVEMAEEMGFNYITVMETSEQWFFKSPARLSGNQ